MNKYQEALSRISKSFMNDNNDYRQYLDSKSAFNKDVEALQELIDNYTKLQQENEELRKIEKSHQELVGNLTVENQKQKEILDKLKGYVGVDYDIDCPEPYRLYIGDDEIEISKERYELFKEWKEND